MQFPFIQKYVFSITFASGMKNLLNCLLEQKIWYLWQYFKVIKITFLFFDLHVCLLLFIYFPPF